MIYPLQWFLRRNSFLNIFWLWRTNTQPQGGSYMSPFWNHILAKKGRFIHVRSQISWYVWSMYLGTKGGFFFLHLYFLCSSPTVLCAALFSYVCTLCTISNTPNFTNCVRTSSDLTICRHTIFPRESEKKSFGSTYSMVQYAKKIEAKKTSRSTIHVICQR